MIRRQIYNGIRFLTVISILLVAAGFVGTTQAFAADIQRGGPGNPGNPDNPGGPGNGGMANGTRAGTALTPLSAAEADALKEAVLEEYKAHNLYLSVIDQFGSVYPFNVIAQSEAQHISALTRQTNKYGVPVPAAPQAGKSTFSTLADACKAGTEAEKADAALYDQLKPVTTHADLLRVYDNLQSASLNNHLPAFEACQ